MSNGDALDQAVNSYREKLRQNPDSLMFVQLADAYRKKGELDEALTVCEDGLKRHPSLLSGLLQLGRIHMARRLYPEAVDALKRVLQREPNNLTAHALLSQALVGMERFTEAIGEYQKILALNPEDSAAQKALQGLLDRMRKDSRAPSGGKETAAQTPKVEWPTMAAAEPVPMEVPAFAAADELAERGLYDEAIEAYQRVLEADPDNFLARQKLRELYAMREAMETPSGPVEAPKSAGTQTTQAEKITDEELVYLLGLMEGTEDAAKAAKAPAPDKAAPPPPPPPEKKAPPRAAKPATPEPVAEPAPAQGAGDAGREERLPAAKRESVSAVLNRLAATEGMRQAFFVAGKEILHSGDEPPREKADKMATLVRLLADVTRRASVNMKHGEAKQVLVFGAEGMVVVSQVAGGILAAVAGASVKVGLLRLALNDCLKRLSEVS